jgi:AAA+ ATPase superfamily predicted ATPase
MTFKGRERELALLREHNWRGRASLVALYGRRRVGKTALVEKAFERDRLWKFEGLEGASAKKQIGHFLLTLSHYVQDPSLARRRDVRTWEQALLLLSEKMGRDPCVVFFDEFQWMAGMRHSLVSIFKWAWDNSFSKKDKCRFILCGSVSSFIVNHVVKSTALYGRVDVELNLRPFSVYDTWRFFDGKRTPRETLDAYLVLGGIPQYLTELNPAKSLVQNLEDLAFSPQGYFYKEYQRLFISHFAKHHLYERILRTLAQKKTGMETSALSRALHVADGGTLSKMLEDLDLAGFIERYTPVDKPVHSRFIRHRIEDEFLDFYFTFIDKNRAAISSGTLKRFDVLTGIAFDQWRGYAFENACRKHRADIARALGFGGIRYRAGAWFRPSKDGATQVDLLFDRADRVLTVCEMKYGGRIGGAAVRERFERRLAVLKNHYPAHGVQKVLIVAEPTSVPPTLKTYFDAVLTAETIFFLPPPSVPLA